MTLFVKGHKTWNKGKKWSNETKQKMREAKLRNPVKYWLGKKRPTIVGKLNPAWNENIGYYALHIWVAKNLGKPKKCEFCGNERNLHWASKSHKAKRDLQDYLSLCASCHKKYDIEYAKNL